MNTKKGFTLVELLVVIGILAILTAAVVVVLNPAELLKQARDTQRLADFDSLRSAVALYMVATATPTIGNAGPYYTGSTTSFCGLGAGTLSTSTAIDGTGWVRINFSSMSNPPSPISALPMDPSNSGITNEYAFKANTSNVTYELDTVLESSKYASKMSSDGGNQAACYEVGNEPGLDL